MKKYKPNFNKLRKQIKKEQKEKLCWKCEHFNGFYFDGVTFDCKVLGDNQMWDFEGDNCSDFNPPTTLTKATGHKEESDG